jgi:AraC-like DNA-binding protein
MQRKVDEPERDRPAAGPVSRSIAQGREWSVAEYLCNAGPGDRSFEERHATYTIAAVLAGSFRYRADTGTFLLHPGAFLLGNHGASFECGHDHHRGDRCLAFHFAPHYFSEVAAAAVGSGKFVFGRGMLPAGPASLAWLARIEAAVSTGDALEVDEAATELMEIVLAAASGAAPSIQRVSAGDERRISAALRVLEEEYTETIALERLAEAAMMSKYHFLRIFRRLVGTTPHQYLLGLRLRKAAVRLACSSAPVTAIAFETGFGDLSTFNARFRRQFGDSPSVYRLRRR